MGYPIFIAKTDKAEGLFVILYTSNIQRHYCPRTLVHPFLTLTQIVKV